MSHIAYEMCDNNNIHIPELFQLSLSLSWISELCCCCFFLVKSFQFSGKIWLVGIEFFFHLFIQSSEWWYNIIHWWFKMKIMIMRRWDDDKIFWSVKLQFKCNDNNILVCIIFTIIIITFIPNSVSTIN